MLKWDFFVLTISKWDILKTDHWKNVSYRIGSLISNFFILNREILTEPIWDFLIPVFLEWFLIPRFWDSKLSTFSIFPCLSATVQVFKQYRIPETGSLTIMIPASHMPNQNNILISASCEAPLAISPASFIAPRRQTYRVGGGVPNGVIGVTK